MIVYFRHLQWFCICDRRKIGGQSPAINQDLLPCQPPFTMPSSTIGENLPATLQTGLVKLFAKPMHMCLEEILVSGTGSSFLTLNRKERCSFSKNPLLLILRLYVFSTTTILSKFLRQHFFGYFFSQLDTTLALEVLLRIMRVHADMRIRMHTFRMCTHIFRCASIS